MDSSVSVFNSLVLIALIAVILIAIGSNVYWWYAVKSIKKDWKRKIDENLLDKRDKEYTRLQELKRSELSQREFEVLQLVADNEVEHIAQKLFISINTVNKHLQSIRRKLKIANIREMVPYSQCAKLMDGVK